MSANRKTKPPPAEEIKILRRHNRTLAKQVKELTAERDQLIHDLNAAYMARITPEQVKAWEKEDEPGGSIEELLEKWRKEVKA